MATVDDLIKADYAAALGMSDAQLSALSITDLKLIFYTNGHLARLSGGGRTIFVQASDPGVAAVNGDLWFDTT